MFSALIFLVSIAALAQFGVFYWRAIIAGIAAGPVSEQVLAAANVGARTLTGQDYRSLAQLHGLTPELCAKSSGLGLVPLYFKLIKGIGILASGRAAALAAWAESERLLCARYAAVQIGRRLQANMQLAASMRSC